MSSQLHRVVTCDTVGASPVGAIASVATGGRRIDTGDVAMQQLTRREALKRGAVVAGGVAWMTPVVQAVGMTSAFAQAVSPGCIQYVINFQVDANAISLPAGTIVDEQWAAFGIHFESGSATHPLMIFDSSLPTGGDVDLGTPHEDFGGPGVGAGGASGQPGENSVGLGNVLIISEDGDTLDPDDNAGGGSIIVTFDAPTDVESVQLLDIDGDEVAGTITTYDDSNSVIDAMAIAALGDNSVQTIDVGSTGVSTLEIFLISSGAVPAITVCLPQ